MIVYKDNADNFRSAVDNNTIVREIEAQYVAKLGRRVAQPEKIADLAEVVYALLEHKQVSLEEFEIIRQRKVDEGGAFRDKLL